MVEIKIESAIELIKETKDNLSSDYLVTGISDFIKNLEVIGQGSQYKFYKINDDFMILEEFPKDENCHYFYLCDSKFDDIGEIGVSEDLFLIKGRY